MTVGTVAGTAYGYLEVQSGGVASGVQVQDGELQIDSGGVASATVLTSSLAGNNEQVYGRAVGTLVQSGAADEVQSGGQSVNAIF